MQQVFLNLLLNARDAMPDGGELNIRTLFDSASGEVVVEFADTGQGIPADALPHVFDPFFTTKPVGAGLGLAVCYGIVTAHGGRITVASDGGRGTPGRGALPARGDRGGGLPRPGAGGGRSAEGGGWRRAPGGCGG